jgi:hypothetical protein
LLKSYGKLVSFPKTGKRGRPRMPKLMLDADLRYAQVIKSKDRISRKTIGFSKKLSELDKQMTLYFAHFNFCRGH